MMRTTETGMEFTRGNRRRKMNSAQKLRRQVMSKWPHCWGGVSAPDGMSLSSSSSSGSYKCIECGKRYQSRPLYGDCSACRSEASVRREF